MADRSSIEWTDATWNTMRGCSRTIAAGAETSGCGDPTGGGCYAERNGYRFAGPGLPYDGLVRMTPNGARWTGNVLMVDKHLLDPLRWERPRRIFTSASALVAPAIARSGRRSVSGNIDRNRHIRALAAAAVAIIESDPSISAADAARLVGVPEAKVLRQAKIRLAVALVEATPRVTVAEIAKACGVGESAVYAAWRAAHPDRPPRGRRISDAMREAMIEPFAALCDTMAEQVTDREQSSAQIFSATREAHGSSVCERRLWRALRRLVDTRRVVRHGARCTGATYTRARTNGESQ